MSGKAARIQLTELMKRILTELSQSRSIGRSIVMRAKVILLGFRKYDSQSIGKELGISAKVAGKWRRRWRDSFAALLQKQFHETSAGFRRAIVECLSDAQRCGAPGTFNAEQVIGIVAIACEPPENSGRPVTYWTGKEIADEAVKRGLVASISASHVNRILRKVDLKPHKSRYWCNTTEKDPEVFQQQVKEVCCTYREAHRLSEECDTHTVCVDEMTSLQANERRAETKHPRPGQTVKEEFQYTRHGTVCVTGNWDVVQGQFFAPTISETRDNNDFAAHIEQTIATDPAAGWVFIVDNLNTHCGAPLVRMVATLLGIDQETLGVVKKQGHLKSMQGRRAFLSDVNHRIRFVYLPKHSSWLNQIEIVFGIINRRVMRRGSFRSKSDLIDTIQRFIKYFNATIARPMKWLYTGQPTHNTLTMRPKTWRELRASGRSWKKLAVVGTYL